ncbi:hypothetical protein IE81DRAFT_184515 [Ceraceosorus guamensis]|uniref:Uncharacterized protein n=1 Tax=Ceraceosorus guamensis TaxID=1522189 RepID=A0A316VV98_9BASI|nr:hypothetical protein IE81DRAFT_184515 [Ceraceosorus guamensis]PWN41204.1 hypothetical protein IE81DRAFT_184515 [Ceraceosorus guamensis]
MIKKQFINSCFVIVKAPSVAEVRFRGLHVVLHNFCVQSWTLLSALLCIWVCCCCCWYAAFDSLLAACWMCGTDTSHDCELLF